MQFKRGLKNTLISGGSALPVLVFIYGVIEYGYTIGSTSLRLDLSLQHSQNINFSKKFDVLSRKGFIMCQLSKYFVIFFMTYHVLYYF